MFIALEGPDGTGKSTLCSILSERLRADSYATPPQKYLTLREQIDKNASPEERYRFYRNGVYDASNEIQMMLAKGRDVICDRYWLSTYTCHQVMGVGVLREDFRSIVSPTLTVILSLNRKVQVERILSRGISAGDKRLLNQQQELSMAFYQNAMKFNIPFVIIDTQNFSPKACAEIVIRAMELSNNP